MSFAAWQFGLIEAVIVSVFFALVWFGADMFTAHTYSSTFYAVWNTTIRLCSFLLIGKAVRRIHSLVLSERHKAESLHKALSEIKVLEGFLSICCQRKRIQNESGQWQEMEGYISEHSDTKFSHSYCPECARSLLEEAGLGKGQPV